MEDAKILDGMAESNGIKGSAYNLMCLDGDECKPGNRKTRKVKADVEILTRVSKLNALHNNDHPSCQQTNERKPGTKPSKKISFGYLFYFLKNRVYNLCP